MALLAWYEYPKMVIDTNDNETGFECIWKVTHTFSRDIPDVEKYISCSLGVYHIVSAVIPGRADEVDKLWRYVQGTKRGTQVSTKLSTSNGAEHRVADRRSL